MGETLRLDQPRGPGAKDCIVDPDALAQAGCLLRRAIEQRHPLIVVNRFGYAESIGGGMRAEIADAACSDAVVLIAVRVSRLEGLERFLGGGGGAAAGFGGDCGLGRTGGQRAPAGDRRSGRWGVAEVGAKNHIAGGERRNAEVAACIGVVATVCQGDGVDDRGVGVGWDGADSDHMWIAVHVGLEAGGGRGFSLIHQDDGSWRTFGDGDTGLDHWPKTERLEALFRAHRPAGSWSASHGEATVAQQGLQGECRGDGAGDGAAGWTGQDEVVGHQVGSGVWTDEFRDGLIHPIWVGCEKDIGAPPASWRINTGVGA